MRQFCLILGLLSFVNKCQSFVSGHMDSSLRSSVVNGISSSVLNITQWTATVVNVAHRTSTISSSHAREKWQTTIVISNYKNNDLASNEQISMPVLSTSYATKDLLNNLMESVVLTKGLSESFQTRTPSLNTHRSIFSGKEHTLEIPSIPSVMIPEIVPTQFEASGIILPPSSGDNTHLATSQRGDKSLISSQEALTKSAFLDPQKKSSELNLQTAHFSSSESVVAQIKSYNTFVRTNNDTKLFTNGSVSMAIKKLPQFFSFNSTTRKTADLKSFSSILALNGQTQSVHNTQNPQSLDTEISTAAPAKENFAGISGISKTTVEAKVATSNQDNISVLNSGLRGSQTAATQVNLTFTSVLTASPVLSSSHQRLPSLSTVTFSTTPLTHLYVTSQISKTFSSETEKEFPTSTKLHSFDGKDSQKWPSVTERSSFTTSEAMVSLGQSATSEVRTLASPSSRLILILQSLPSLPLNASDKENSFMSLSFEESFSSATSVENIVGKTFVSSTLEVPQALNSSPPKQTALHIDSSTSDIKLEMKTIGHYRSLISQISLESPKRVVLSSSLELKRSHNTEMPAVGSSSDTGYSTSYSSSPWSATSLSSPDLRKPSPTAKERPTSASKTKTEIQPSFFQKRFESTELAVPSTHPTNSRFHTSQNQTTASYLELSRSFSKFPLGVSSAQSAPLSSGVAPSPPWQGRFHDSHDRTSSVEESQHLYTDGENQTPFSVFSPAHSSIVSTEFVARSNTVSDSTVFSTTIAKDSTATATYQQILSSDSKPKHKTGFTSAQKSMESMERVTTTSALWNHSYIQHNTGSVVTSIQPKPVTSSKRSHETVFSLRSSRSLNTLVTPSSASLRSQSEYQNERSLISPAFYSTIDKEIRPSSFQNSTISKENGTLSFQSQSHFQTRQKRISVAESVSRKPSPSPSVTGHHVRLSSSQSLVISTKLVQLSSYTRSSSHFSFRTGSSESKRLSPSLSLSGAVSTFDEKLRRSTAFGVMPSRVEFESKIAVYPVPDGSSSSKINIQLDTTVTPTETSRYSNTEAGTIPTAQPTTATVDSDHINLLLVVAIVPSVVLCVFFAAVLFFRRSRRRKNNFRYSIKLEYRDENNGFRSRCVNSRLDLSLKGIHIDLELPNSPANRVHSRDSTGYSRGPSFAETQMRELQFLSQECKENLEWISEVLVRDMETSMCGRSQPSNRESVYSVKEKGSFQPGEKIIRRESSKRGRETVKWKVPLVRRRDSGEFGLRDSICTEDTTLTTDLKNDRETCKASRNNVDTSGNGKEQSHVTHELF